MRLYSRQGYIKLKVGILAKRYLDNDNDGYSYETNDFIKDLKEFIPGYISSYYVGDSILRVTKLVNGELKIIEYEVI